MFSQPGTQFPVRLPPCAVPPAVAGLTAPGGLPFAPAPATTRSTRNTTTTATIASNKLAGWGHGVLDSHRNRGRGRRGRGRGRHDRGSLADTLGEWQVSG